MAYDLLNEKLIDENNGQQDLQDKIIRTVGNAEERFQEDFSRMLRALHFSLQLGFKIEPNTWHTIKNMMPNINNTVDGKRVLPYEIVAEEFLKSFKFNPVGALDLWDESGAIAEITPELLTMKGCPQPDNWHTEGDVWQHTRLALEKLSAKEFQDEFPKGDDLELVVAVLFHDIGKPATVRTPEKDGTDRIRFDEHDVIGAEMTKKILDRIKVAAPPDFDIKPERVAFAVRYHMLIVHGDPREMRPTTLEKYFLNPAKGSELLLKLMLADGLATVKQDGLGMRDDYDLVRECMAKIKKTTGSHGFKLVKPLLSGDDIMKTIKIKAGPKVGEILEQVRQKQLTGELKSKTAAIEFIQGLK
jgi:poly(A) polymerase